MRMVRRKADKRRVISGVRLAGTVHCMPLVTGKAARRARREVRARIESL